MKTTSKFLKKGLPLLMVLCLLLGIFASCGNGAKTPVASGDTEAKTAATTAAGGDETQPDPTQPAKPALVALPEGDLTASFKDGEIHFLMRTGGILHICFFAEEDSTDTVEQACYTRNELVQETYGVEFVLDRMLSEDDNANGLYGINQLTAGVDTYDVIAPHGRIASAYASRGLCLDWYTLPYLNLYYDWWTQSARESFTINDKLLFTTGDLDHTSSACSYCLIFNRQILRDLYNDEDKMPAAHVKDDTWTLETFKQMAYDSAYDMDGDGYYVFEEEKDRIGYATYPWQGPYCSFFASGSRIISRNDEGMPYFTLNTTGAYEALKTFCKMMEDDRCYLNATDSNPMIPRGFRNGRITFLDYTLSGIENDFRQSDLDYGIVPFPKASADGEYASHIAGSYNQFVIPKIVESRGSAISAILEMLCQEGQKQVIPVYYNNAVTRKTMKDEENFEMLSYITQNRVYDLGYFIGSLEGMSSFPHDIALSGINRYESTYKSIIGPAEEKLKQYVKAYFDPVEEETTAEPAA